MKIVMQRVGQARVEVGSEVTASIGTGLLILLGIGVTDTESDADYLVDRAAGIRIFPDAAGKMNRSIREAGGSLLVVSQFTLYGNCHKGRRPSFDGAAGALRAQELYHYFLEAARKTGIPVQAGVFQAHMAVHLVNDGPVTILCDSEDR